MATRAEMANAKKTTELLLAAEGKDYDTWLFEVHNRYIAESGDVVHKALKQMVSRNKSGNFEGSQGGN